MVLGSYEGEALQVEREPVDIANKRFILDGHCWHRSLLFTGCRISMMNFMHHTRKSITPIMPTGLRWLDFLPESLDRRTILLHCMKVVLDLCLVLDTTRTTAVLAVGKACLDPVDA